MVVQMQFAIGCQSVNFDSGVPGPALLEADGCALDLPEMASQGHERPFWNRGCTRRILLPFAVRTAAYGVICTPTCFVKFIGNGHARPRCARGVQVRQMEGIPVHQAQLPRVQRH